MIKERCEVPSRERSILWNQNMWLGTWLWKTRPCIWVSFESQLQSAFGTFFLVSSFSNKWGQGSQKNMFFLQPTACEIKTRDAYIETVISYSFLPKSEKQGERKLGTMRTGKTHKHYSLRETLQKMHFVLELVERALCRFLHHENQHMP